MILADSYRQSQSLRGAMAKPRFFISSTYFDLRTVRADLERFTREMGYEPVLFERGNVPYGKDDALEDYCYREINSCDVLVAIIGGKFGSQSKDGKHSITHRPEQGIRVHASIFDKDSNLKVFTPEQWKEKWISTYTYDDEPVTAEDDEVPF